MKSLTLHCVLFDCIVIYRRLQIRLSLHQTVLCLAHQTGQVSYHDQETGENIRTLKCPAAACIRYIEIYSSINVNTLSLRRLLY